MKFSVLLLFFWKFHLTSGFFGSWFPSTYLADHNFMNNTYFFHEPDCDEILCRGTVLIYDHRYFLNYSVFINSIIQARTLCSIISNDQKNRYNFDEFLVDITVSNEMIERVMEITCQTIDSCLFKRVFGGVGSIIECFFQNTSR